jgi:4-hydroxybenzoate polyprenyltransferase
VTPLLAFARERLSPTVFGPAIVLLSALALWGGWGDGLSATPPFEVGGAAASVALFVVRYRIWDDLADRDRDRRHFPNRVVVTHAPSTFRRVHWLLFAAHTTLFSATGAAAALSGLVVLELAFVGAYRWRNHLAPLAWRFPVLLAKYPAFVLVTALAGPAPTFDRVIPAALAAYAGAWLYEALHQPRRQGALS